MRTRFRPALVSVVLLAALPLAAQMHRGRPATGNAPAGAGMGGAWVVVAPDGTAVTTRLLPATSGAPAREEIVAVNASGSVAWTFGADRPIHLVALSGGLVLASAGARGPMMQGAGDEGALIALALSDGALAWTLPLEGFATDVEAAPAGGVYVVVTKPAASGTPGPGTGPGTGRPGMGPGTGSGWGTMMTGPRTLVSVSANGAVLWSVKLTE